MARNDWRDDPGIFDHIDEVKVDEDGTIVDLEKRPRGVLSHTDREYLCGLRDYEHAQSEANRKQDIRERIANSFLDFQLLVRLHDDYEQHEALRADLGEEQLYRSFEDLVAYVYHGGLLHQLEPFEKLIERGVYIGANTDPNEPLAGEVTNVDVSINIDHRPNVEQLVERLEDGEVDQLTPAEIGVLAQEGELDADDLEAIEDVTPKTPHDSSNPDVSESDDSAKE